ncbi:MAG TPA: hypothetical protein VF881_10765, partial [Polyangiaceae bacterium]
IIAISTGLVVAWIDDSSAATGPDIKYRTFGFDLAPTSNELSLADTVANEGDVALARWGSGWAAAWRAGNDGLETIEIKSGSTRWTTGPFLPGPVGSAPGIAELDETHLLVVYAEGADPAETGVANNSKLRAAVVDLGAPGTVTSVDVPAQVSASAGLAQDQPNAVTLGKHFFVSWRTASALANAQGEELWLKELGWNGTSLDLGGVERPLPRSPTHRAGDQRHPALAPGPLAPVGEQLVIAFDDLGGSFGTAERNGDVVTESLPVPIVRLPDPP